MANLNYRAKKRFGQNFLIDHMVIEEILDSINIDIKDDIVEIGPGLGAITFPILEQVETLRAIELDKDLIHRFKFSKYVLDKRLSIIEMDALKVDFNSLFREKKLKIVGNLPYNIITPLLFHLFNSLDVIDSMYFMVQKEIADRLVADPGTKDYGKLGVMAQYFTKTYTVVQVPAECFSPPPKVESAFIKMVPKDNIDFSLVKTLNTVLTNAFNQRRKKITNSLSNLISEEDLLSLDIDVTKRPENLSLDEYIKIASFLK
ncbi:MAG: 16S rRNA (adenine(1518)-N(6)/adenine(1519)-N(6))-dimethyltransferase RsmA [Psittacicella sp.]